MVSGGISLRPMDHAPAFDLDALHRRYDGSPSGEELRLATLGGPRRADAVRHAAVMALHERLAAEARLGTARRRAALSGRACVGDGWLKRLTLTLAHHREIAITLSRTVQRNAYSQ